MLPALVLFGTMDGFAQAPQDSSPATLQSELAGKFNEAITAFQAADYATSVSKLEEVIARAGEGANLESAYFTLGASYFNLEQYGRAIEVLKTYLKKYPKEPRVIEVCASIGQASLMTKDYAEAAAQFARLENEKAWRERALYYGALALEQGNRPDEAIKKSEALISPEIRTPLAVDGAMRLAGLYAKKKEKKKVTALVEKILKKSDLVENMVRLNAMAVELGDSQLEDGEAAEALSVYQVVRSRDDVIKFQVARVASLENKLQETLTAIRADPKGVTQFFDRLGQLRSEISGAKSLEEEARKLPDFATLLDLRLGRCFYDLGQKWESLVAYGDVLKRYPDSKEKEPALFACIVNFAELNRVESARDFCEKYLKDFPQGPNANTVGYLLGATALQAQDPAAAETYFGRALKDQPGSTFAEEMRFLLGNAKFAQGKYEEALGEYEKYRADFPKGAHAEEAGYRIAVSRVFSGQYEKALAALEDYIKLFPRGSFASDARYRIAVCLYAAQQYDDVIARCERWRADFGSDPQLGEVLGLLGDAWAAKGDADKSIDAYVRSYKAATTAEVLSYSLFAAQKGMQKKGDWAGIGTMFEEFAKEHPDDPLIPMAMYWIGRAKAKVGKADEAKVFVADTIKRYIDDPRRDAVEQLLTQLAQLCVRKRQPPDGTAPVPDSAAELNSLLGAAGERSPAAKARILYAQSELARLRKNTDEQAAKIDEIARNFAPEDLSPYLLALSGDHLLGLGEKDKAAGLYRFLMETFPKCDVVDYAYSGLGEIALQNKDSARALELFDEAVDKGVAGQKLKEITIGRARALLALGRLDEAQKSFEQVASVREWRGDATAQAVFSLGEIEFQRGKWAEANVLYQRVFVAYQKFLPWVAKSYVRSMECFEKLGMKPEAIRTGREMLRNEKLTAFPESATARDHLKTLEGTPG